MGVFHDMVELVNRTSQPLQIMFDGQRTTLEPNYTKDGQFLPDVHNMVPRQVVPYALNQTVIMGSEDVKSPSTFRSKVGVIDRRAEKDPKFRKKSWHDISFFDTRQETEITRVPAEQILEEFAEPGAKIRAGGRKHRPSDAAIDAATAPFDFPGKS